MSSPVDLVGRFLRGFEGLASREDLFRFQFDLIEEITACERRWSQLVDKPGSSQGPNSSASRHALGSERHPGEISELEDVAFAKVILLHFGDSLAWLLLDRTHIRGASTGQKGGHITFRSGFDTEVQAFELLRGEPTVKFAILNDLTNCLCVGDITALDEDGLRLIEVKGSDSWMEDPRALRQVERAKWFLSYTSVDEGELPDGLGDAVGLIPKSWKRTGKPRFFRTRTEREEKYHHTQLSNCIEKTLDGSEGWSTTILANAGVLGVWLASSGGEQTNQLDILDGLRDGTRKEILMGLVNRQIDDFHDLLPIPLFDISDRAKTALLTDAVHACVVYPRNRLEEAFLKRGYRCLPIRPPVGNSPFTLEKDGLKMAPMDYLFRRLLYETLELDSLVGIMDDAFKQLIAQSREK